MTDPRALVLLMLNDLPVMPEEEASRVRAFFIGATLGFWLSLILQVL